MKQPYWIITKRNTYSGSQPMPIHTIATWFLIVGFIFGVGFTLLIVGKSKIHPPPIDYTAPK